MKLLSWTGLMFLLLVSSSINAHLYEWRFQVKNSYDQYQEVHVDLYKYNETYETLTFLYHHDTYTTPQCSCNGGCDINDQPNGATQCPDVLMWPTLEFSGSYIIYVVVIETEYFCKLKVPYNYDGDGADFDFNYNTDDTHEFWLSSNNRNAEILDQGAYTDYEYTIQNNFDGVGGGLLKIGEDDNLSSPQYPTFDSWTYPHNAYAKNYQVIDSYKREFTHWEKNDVSVETNLKVSLDKGDNITYEANFIKLYEITVQNNLPGYGNSGIITVELSSENSPYYFDVEETKDFTASGITQTIDNVQFTFDEWYKNGSPTQETSPFEPSGNDTYTAKYNAKPLGWTRQIQCTSNIGQPIRITWNDHPSENVTSYQIWRKAGSSGTPSNEGSVNRSVETWTDPDYTRTGSTLDPLLQYDVRPYYAPTSTYGDSNFVNVAYGFIEETVQQADAGSHATVAEEISPNYFIGSYPNPFNPQTTIKYNLPAAGFVSLKVYNSIGKEVAELVNGVKEEGSYSVDFDGTDLASGIYIYSIRVNDFIQSGKMLLVK